MATDHAVQEQDAGHHFHEVLVAAERLLDASPTGLDDLRLVLRRLARQLASYAVLGLMEGVPARIAFRSDDMARKQPEWSAGDRAWDWRGDRL